MSDYISIGKFVAVHGLKGALVLKHVLGKKTALKGVQAVFTEAQKDSYMPWFIQDTKARTDTETLVKLDGLDSPEAAKKLNQKTIWLSKADFEKQASESAAISYIGYAVVEDGIVLGTVTEVIEQPHQVLLAIYIGEKEALIPLHQDSLVRVDRTKKEVHVDLPEGLLDLYL